MRDDRINLKLRDARTEDLEVLTSIEPKRAIHSDRIRDAQGSNFRYLVVERENVVVGYGLLVFKTPEMKFLPSITDLYIRPEFRSQGIGTFMIHEMEKIALERGYREIFIGVDPKGNERAYSLYLRLGYKPIQEEPYLNHWSITTSDGEIHEGHDWNIDLRKSL